MTTHLRINYVKTKLLIYFFAYVVKKKRKKTQNSLGNFSDQDVYTRHTRLDSSLTHFQLQPVYTNTLILTIKHFINTKSFGSYNISFRFVRYSLFVLAFYGMFIINTSIVTFLFPKQWMLYLLLFTKTET